MSSVSSPSYALSSFPDLKKNQLNMSNTFTLVAPTRQSGYTTGHNDTNLLTLFIGDVRIGVVFE